MIPPGHPLQLALGLIVWSLWFLGVYAGLSVACAVAPPDISRGAITWINGVLLAPTLAVAALLLYWGGQCWRASGASEGNPRKRFIARVGAGVHLAGAVAALAIGLPLLRLPPCV